MVEHAPWMLHWLEGEEGQTDGTAELEELLGAGNAETEAATPTRPRTRERMSREENTWVYRVT